MLVVLVPNLGVSRSALEVSKSEDCDLGVLEELKKPLKLSAAGLLLVLGPNPPADGTCSDNPVPNPPRESPAGAGEVEAVERNPENSPDGLAAFV